jgi:hypothetical protein
MPGTVVEAWEFDPSCELSDVAKLAMERLAPPSFSARVLSTRGDALTLQVQEGAPSGDPRSLYYVGGHGAFALARREEWPPAPGRAEKRLLLTLLAFPHPQAAPADPAVR